MDYIVMIGEERHDFSDDDIDASGITGKEASFDLLAGLPDAKVLEADLTVLTDAGPIFDHTEGEELLAEVKKWRTKRDTEAAYRAHALTLLRSPDWDELERIALGTSKLSHDGGYGLPDGRGTRAGTPQHALLQRLERAGLIRVLDSNRKQEDGERYKLYVGEITTIGLNARWERAEAATVTALYEQIRTERARQESKFPKEVLPHGTGKEHRAAADAARAECDAADAAGELSWRHVLAEEVAEAFAEESEEALEAELVQVAAVAIRWLEAIKRGKAANAFILDRATGSFGGSTVLLDEFGKPISTERLINDDPRNYTRLIGDNVGFDEQEGNDSIRKLHAAKKKAADDAS